MRGSLPHHLFGFPPSFFFFSTSIKTLCVYLIAPSFHLCCPSVVSPSPPECRHFFPFMAKIHAHRREYMEDCTIAHVDMTKQGTTNTSFFGVFDGHSGKRAASFAKARYHTPRINKHAHVCSPTNAHAQMRTRTRSCTRTSPQTRFDLTFMRMRTCKKIGDYNFYFWLICM